MNNRKAINYRLLSCFNQLERSSVDFIERNKIFVKINHEEEFKE